MSILFSCACSESNNKCPDKLVTLAECIFFFLLVNKRSSWKLIKIYIVVIFFSISKYHFQPWERRCYLIANFSREADAMSPIISLLMIGDYGLLQVYIYSLKYMDNQHLFRSRFLLMIIMINELNTTLKWSCLHWWASHSLNSGAYFFQELSMMLVKE